MSIFNALLRPVSKMEIEERKAEAVVAAQETDTEEIVTVGENSESNVITIAHPEESGDVITVANYFKAKEIAIDSKEYADLLLKAYEAMCLQNTMFQDALKASYPRILMHTIGKWRRGQTVLTWWEFIRILSKLRSSIIRESRVKSEGEK